MSREKLQDFRDFVYSFENLVDELVIVLLSVGAVIVAVYNLFIIPQNETLNFMGFGNIIYEWIVMLSLMIIGRELWLLNRNISSYLEQEGER